MIANDRKGYSSIEGDMWYGNMDHEKAEDFRGEIVMNGEEVWRTVDNRHCGLS
jgi:(2Fe-2S) ferredoxin